MMTAIIPKPIIGNKMASPMDNPKALLKFSYKTWKLHGRDESTIAVSS